MYGFGGVGQVEVRFGQMSPWLDEQTNELPTEQGKIGLLRLWKAEMSNSYLPSTQKSTFFNIMFLGLGIAHFNSEV